MTGALHRPRSALRVGRTVAGVLVVLAGVILLPLPGPGTLVILAGLALLARDHDWAARLLQRARAAATRTGRTLRRRHGDNAEATQPEGPR